ncbi:MAG TPA: Tim44-like domain-containing protein [Burkholderiales bacterium]|nr:Tim44-like domain-containing protein [Burkholderiales bacterium]
MKALTVSLIALVFGAAVAADDAQAARLGGGRSLGAQRQITAPPKQATAPAQQQPASAPQPAGPGRWLGPIAGLAAGLGLGWLFAQGGFGSAIGALLMALLAGAVVFALMRFFSRGRPQASPLQYAGLGNETVAAPPPSQLPGDAGARPDFRSQFAPNIPSSFDVDGFLREARRNFLRLQEANDRGDLMRLRQVTTQEMFDALKGDAQERSPGQQTDVVTLNASLLELVTESDLHWASVRFSGSMREEAKSAAEPFEEIWNLCKPVNGSSGWLLAGIQQTH